MIMGTVQVLEQRRLVLMVTIMKLAQMPSLKLGTVLDSVEEIALCMTVIVAGHHLHGRDRGLDVSRT